jgi:hypothetical protein
VRWDCRGAASTQRLDVRMPDRYGVELPVPPPALLLCPATCAGRHNVGVGSTEDAFEAEAKRVLQRLVGGELVDRDVDGAQNTRDFDLVADDGAVHAVEVTSVQLPTARATRSGIERLRKKDLGLTATWGISVYEEAPTQPIAKNAPRLLNLLYARGVTEFDDLNPPTDPDLAAAVHELASLHIPTGRASAAAPFRIHAAGFGSGSVDPANLTRAVETEAAKEDNRRKLARAPTGARRHLFVWLHDSHWYVASLLRSPISTPPAPLLPPEVDVVWAAVGEGRDAFTCSRLLRGNRTGFTEIDPASGTELPRRTTPGAASGPPDEPICPVCQGHGTWTIRPVDQLDPTTGQETVVLTWQASCARDTTHWAMPGRSLSAAELHARDRMAR